MSRQATAFLATAAALPFYLPAREQPSALKRPTASDLRPARPTPAVSTPLPLTEGALYVLSVALNGKSMTIPLGPGGPETQLPLSAGNLGYDNGLEFAVVINEVAGALTDASSYVSDGDARYFVFDDVPTDFAELRSRIVPLNTDTAVVTAKVGSVALGDVDGDNVDEMVLGGFDIMGNVGSNGEPHSGPHVTSHGSSRPVATTRDTNAWWVRPRRARSTLGPGATRAAASAPGNESAPAAMQQLRPNRIEAEVHRGNVLCNWISGTERHLARRLHSE